MGERKQNVMVTFDIGNAETAKMSDILEYLKKSKDPSAFVYDNDLNLAPLIGGKFEVVNTTEKDASLPVRVAGGWGAGFYGFVFVTNNTSLNTSKLAEYLATYRRVVKYPKCQFILIDLDGANKPTDEALLNDENFQYFVESELVLKKQTLARKKGN